MCFCGMMNKSILMVSYIYIYVAINSVVMLPQFIFRVFIFLSSMHPSYYTVDLLEL